MLEKVASLKFSRLALLVLVIALLAVPLVVKDKFTLHVFNMIFINALIALGLNVIIKTGQLSLGHAAFMSVGAYASAQMTLKFGLPFMLSFLIAGVAAGLVGAILGRFILRLKGVYFVLFTFALNEFFVLMSKNFKSLTGGNAGLPGIQPPTLPFLSSPLDSPGSYYYLSFSLLLLTVGFLYLLYKSAFGRAMDAIRESEVLAASTGYNPMKIKVIAFTIGCALAGFGGSLFAHFLLYISPFSFTFWQSVNFLLMNIIGGTTSLAGALIGAAIFTPLPELLRDYVLWQQVLYGGVLMLFMRLLPDGVVVLPALVRRLVLRLRQGSAQPLKNETNEAGER